MLLLWNIIWSKSSLHFCVSLTIDGCEGFISKSINRQKQMMPQIKRTNILQIIIMNNFSMYLNLFVEWADRPSELHWSKCPIYRTFTVRRNDKLCDPLFKSTIFSLSNINIFIWWVKIHISENLMKMSTSGESNNINTNDLPQSLNTNCKWMTF